MATDELTPVAVAPGRPGDGQPGPPLSPGTAAGLLARMKLRLLANSLRVGWRTAVGIALGALFALPPALGGAALLILMGDRAPHLADYAIPLLAALLVLVWMLGPIFSFGTDETLDPSRLALLPLGPAQLMAGLLAASSIGVAPLATLLLLVGMAVSVAKGPAGWLVAPVASIGLFLLCVAAGRALTTGLSTLLRTRRARDLIMMVLTLLTMGLGIGVQFLVRFIAGVPRDDLGRALDGVVGVVNWTPPGFAARAMLAARDGDLLGALVALLALAASVAALLWLWWRGLDRLATRPEAATTRRGRESGSLFAGPLALLPRTPLGATAATQLRSTWRDPRTRAAYLGMVVLSLTAIVLALFAPGFDDRRVLFSVLFIAWMGSAAGFNQYGYDGRAYWMIAVSGSDPADDLAGRNLGLVLIDLLLVVLVTVALATATGGWGLAPVVVGLACAVIGSTLAAGNLASVLLPQPQPEVTGNLWALGSTGTGFTSAMGQMLALFVSGLLMLPPAALTVAGLAGWGPGLVLAGVTGPPYGLFLAWLGRRLAARWVRGHQPELLASLNPRRAG